MEQLQTDKINELRRELTLTRASFEQKLNDAENKIREFKKIGEDRKRLIDENKEALTSIEQENNQLKDENKKMKEELEKTLYECAHQEKLLEQERQSRISLETAKVQEMTQAKDAYEKMSALRQQHHSQIQKLENDLQESRSNEYQLQHKFKLLEFEKDSYVKRCASLEKDVDQWQSLAKSTLEDKNVEVEKLNRDLQSATIELEKYKQSSQSYERAYKEQLIVAQKANSDRDEMSQYHREQVKLLNVEIENAQRLIHVHEKRDEENQKIISETKGVVDDLNNTLLETNAKLEESINENQHLRNEIQRLEEENRQLNDISAISDTTPMGAVNLALQKKGKSIIQLYSEYSKLQDQLIIEEKKNYELLQLLNSFNHEIGQFSPVINEKNEEFDRIVKEYKQMSEQLSERDKEIEKVRASLKISRSENQELNERIMELQEEKEFCVKHNTSLLEELDKLRKEGSTNLDANISKDESTKSIDLDSLYSRNLHLEAEKTVMIRRMQSYQNMINELEAQISLKSTENKNAVGEVTRLQHRLKQYQTQIDTLERERELVSRKRYSLSSDSTPQANISPTSRQLDFQAENVDLKNRLDIATDELKNYDEKLRKTNQELNALRHEKIQFTYDKQHLEERYKILDNHFNIKNDENRSNKELLRQVQKINEQLEKQARQADNERIISSQELKTLQNEYNTRKDEWEQLQRKFNKEMDELMADKQKAEITAQGLQQLSEEKQRLENEFKETQEKLLASQVKLDRLNAQHEELSEKYSSVLTKSAEDKNKLTDENAALQNKLNSLEADHRKLNDHIDSLNKEIQEYKDKVNLLETQDQGIAIAQLRKELDLLKKENEELRKDYETYKDLAELREKSLEDNQRLYLELKSATDQERKDNNNTIKLLQEELQKNKDELKLKEDNLNSNLKDLSDALDKLSASQQALDEIMTNSAAKDKQYSEETKRRETLLEESQQNYNRELAAHAAAVQSLNDIQQLHKVLQEEFNQFKIKAQQTESSLNDERVRFEKELAEFQQKCKDFEEDNKVLRNYFNNTPTDMTAQNQVISLLRSDQQKAEAEKDYYAKQAERYKAQLEQTQKNYDEIQVLLLKERAEKAAPDQQLTNELLEAQKLSKILDESNQTLRNEKENLDKKMVELESSIKISDEKNNSLEDEIRTLKVDLSTYQQEINLLKDDNNKWRDRFQTVLNKYGINDPTELQQLQDNLKSVTENLKVITEERDRMKSEIDRLNADIDSHKKQINDLKSTSDSATKSNHTLKAQFDNLKISAMKFKTDRDNYKTKIEQMEKENTQFKQENAQSKMENTKLRESLEGQKKKFQGHVQNMQRTLQQKATSQLQVYQEQSKKEIEELKKQIEELKKQNEEKTKQVEEKTKQVEEKTKQVEEKTKQVEEKTRQVEEKTKQVEEKTKQVEEKTKQVEEKTKQVEEALEKEPELLRIKAQESMYKSKISRLETENTELKQKFQSSSESSLKEVVASQPTAETIAKDTAVKTEEFLQSLLPMTSVSSLIPTTTNLPGVTSTVHNDSNTTTSPGSPFQAVQELHNDAQENVLQPPVMQQITVQPAATAASSGDGPNMTGASVSVRLPGSNTGQIQNAPREKPPVKIQRHRGPLVLPSSPRGPSQVASPTPTVEEQPLNQSQTVSDTEKVVQPSEVTEAIAITVQPAQEVPNEIQPENEPLTSVLEETPAEATVRKRSWDEVETQEESLASTSAVQVEDFDITIPSNIADGGDEEEVKGDAVANSPTTNDDVAGFPATKKIKYFLSENKNTRMLVLTAFAGAVLKGFKGFPVIYAEENPAKKKLSIYDEPKPDIILVESPTRLEKEIRQTRIQVIKAARDFEQQIHGVANKWIAIEQDTEKIVAQDERLMPGALYISVAGLAGTIIARNRNVLLRIASPLFFTIASSYYFLPKTSHNILKKIQEYEQKSPKLLKVHYSISEVASDTKQKVDSVIADLKNNNNKSK
ncbi:18464_t:CDS:10 [Rhizophagus irregularis]|nr:18464_t:CDS:10 [Rhizophagus irregularis]